MLLVNFKFPSLAGVMLLLLFIGSNFSFNAQVPSYVPTDGLVGWWPFNGNANDESGNGRNGQVTDATLTTDRLGNNASAFNFNYVGYSNGSLDDMIYVPHDSGLNSSELSVSCWFKPLGWSFSGNPGASVVFARFENGYDNPHGEFWGISFNDEGKLRCSLIGESQQNYSLESSAGALNLGNWYHVVLTYDGSVQKIYLNGILIDQFSSPNLLNTQGSSGLSFGVSNQANGFWSPFNGDIDDSAVWNRALTLEEVTALYTGQPIITDCLDPQACNFEAVDEECIFPEPNFDCAGNCLNDADGDGVCDENDCSIGETLTITQGDSVTLSSADPYASAELIWSGNMTFTSPSTLTTPLLEVGTSYRLDVEGFYDVTTSAYGLFDAAWYFCYFGCGCVCNSENPAPLIAEAMNGAIIPLSLRPSPDEYNSEHQYEYIIVGDGSSMTFSFEDSAYGDNSGALSFSLYKNFSSEFIWQTGDTGPVVSLAPVESTTVEIEIVGPEGQVCNDIFFIEVLIPGCTDEGACNYEVEATDDDGSCIYPEPNLDCAGNCLNDSDGDGVCDENEIAGCNDTSACNYNSEATEEDGTCILPPELDLPESITICEGESVVLDAGAGYDSYLWSTGDTTQTIEVNEAGSYSVEVGNAYGLPANGNLPAYLPEDGLVGWWPFNGNANDESGNGNSGTVNGATLGEDRNGNVNSAYSYDSNGDRIGFGDWSLLDNTASMSIQLWLRPADFGVGTGSNMRPIISKWYTSGASDNNVNSFIFYLGSGSIVFGFEDVTGQIFEAVLTHSLTLNEWHHLAVSVGEEYISVYENGQLLGAVPTNHTIINNSSTNLYFGDWLSSVVPNYSSFLGDLDDIAIYNRALSEQEIQQLYTAQTLCSASATIEVIVQSLGCTDPEACNYNEEAGCDDNSCTYPAESYLDCAGNCLNDTNNNGICDELDVPGCTFEGACNYNPEATVDDGSCFFATAVFDCEGNCLQDENNNGICDQLEALGPQFCGESTIWNEDLGACVCEGFNPCTVDMNENGVIDVADLLMFLTLIGQPCY